MVFVVYIYIYIYIFHTIIILKLKRKDYDDSYALKSRFNASHFPFLSGVDSRREA